MSVPESTVHVVDDDEVRKNDGRRGGSGRCLCTLDAGNGGDKRTL
jgi:hypothetical protein